MELEQPKYEGQEKRTNNCIKLKLTFKDYFKVFSTIIIMVAIGAGGWVTLNMRVNAMAEEVNKVETNEKDIIIVKQDVKHIKEDEKILLEVKK